MTDKTDSNSTIQYARLGYIALVVTIVVSATGFLVGVGEQATDQNSVAIANSHPTETHAAYGQPTGVIGYAEMSQSRRGPNAKWKSNLSPHKENLTAAYGEQASSVEQRRVAIAARKGRRAYSGAPPVVPHAIDERNPQACLTCHGQGLRVGAIVAPKMSHQFLPNCIQCHVESQQDFPGVIGAGRLTTYNFVGLAEPGEGNRIGPGAPPTIPHRLWMRSECLSCHGTLGNEGLRSSHPWRTNCTQCHAPSRDFDWSPMQQPQAVSPVKQEETEQEGVLL